MSPKVKTYTAFTTTTAAAALGDTARYWVSGSLWFSWTIMSDCANTQIGVWSENSLDRTAVTAVYGQPK